MAKTIEITFKADGTTQLEGIGFKGKECDQKMAEFEKALGTQTSRTNKPDYYQKQTTGLKQTT